MLKFLFPDTYMVSTYVISFEKLYEEGIRGVIFDIDNTLVPHGAKADERSIELFETLEKLGMKTCLLSNNNEARVKMFNKDIGVDYIAHAKKPMRRNYVKAMEIMGTNKTNTLFIGDQLFTDVLGAKRTGIRNILVKPIDQMEEIYIVLKRYVEKCVLYFYKKEKKVEK